MEKGEKGWIGGDSLMGSISWFRNHAEPSRHRRLPHAVQAATMHPCATWDSAEDPPKRCSTAFLPNHAQSVLISIHTLHGPDHSDLLSVNKIFISQLSVRGGDPCSDPGCQTSSLYKSLLLLPFIVLCIFQ